jgi:FxsC-like protein
MASPSPSPHIITFYSYKGGTGRSMALANVAWILASNGKRVLLVDWDLEAPGLHRYLHPFLRDKTLAASEGIIDFVVDFAFAAASGEKQADENWFLPHANILRYASSIAWTFPPPGTIDFVPAGRQGSDYATRVNSFNWESFYRRLGGGLFLEAAKKSMASYDYVLIDSRTGVSDTSGICTVQMPDRLVVCFTLNSQSIEGAAAVAESAHRQRMKPNGEPGLKIFPVPTRVELSEKQRLDLANDLARRRFEPLMWHVPASELDRYWSSVRVLYHSFYAYEEVLATFADKPMQPQSVVLPSMEALTEYITDSEVQQFPPLEETVRLELLERYLRKPPAVAASQTSSSGGSWIFYFSYSRSNLDQYLKRFFEDLSVEVSIRLGLSRSDSVGFFDEQDIAAGEQWSEITSRALRTSRLLVCMVSPGYLRSGYNGKEVAVFEQRVRLTLDAAHEPRVFMPVIWSPVQRTLPGPLGRIQLADERFPVEYRENGLRYLMRLRRFEDHYHEVTSLLADALVDAHQSGPLPLLDNVRPLNEVPDALAGLETIEVVGPSGPRHVDCVFVVASREELSGVRKDLNAYTKDNGWLPFAPAVKYDIGVLAFQTAVEGQLTYGTFPVGPDLLERIEAASRNNSMVVVIVDAWALAVETYRRMMMSFDRLASFNTAVLIVFGSDTETAEQYEDLVTQIRIIFPHRLLSKDAYVRSDIRSVQDFKAQFIDATNAIRVGMIERAQVLRTVEDRPVPRPSISGPPYP